MSYLNEPSVLWNLKVRLEQGLGLQPASTRVVPCCRFKWCSWAHA